MPLPIPKYQSFFLPLLLLASEGNVHSVRDTIETLSKQLNLSDEEQKALLPSATQRIVDNRIGWARTYLTKDGLLETPKRGYFYITLAGRALLATNLQEINVNALMQHDTFQEFRARKSSQTENKKDVPGSPHATPQEQLEEGIEKINQNFT